MSDEEYKIRCISFLRPRILAKFTSAMCMLCTSKSSGIAESRKLSVEAGKETTQMGFTGEHLVAGLAAYPLEGAIFCSENQPLGLDLANAEFNSLKELLIIYFKRAVITICHPVKY